ncbi:MAG TPA: antibiotic biosynthesis monooxygenase family protein [Flavobacteriales bacterium]|nr:antibiotic biosynthesis monooxygenase family protein [Flavobacteriales bacterium]
MITRVVKMSFEADRIELFKKIFAETKGGIRAFPGCNEVNLFQHATDPSVFFTISKWNSEADLDHYRNSEFFAKVWNMTRQGFKAKPEAWTLQEC